MIEIVYIRQVGLSPFQSRFLFIKTKKMNSWKSVLVVRPRTKEKSRKDEMCG